MVLQVRVKQRWQSPRKALRWKQWGGRQFWVKVQERSCAWEASHICLLCLGFQSACSRNQ